MKELHERVAELEARIGRLEGIVGDPEKATLPRSSTVFAGGTAWPSSGEATSSWPDDPENDERVDVVSGGTVLSPT